MLPVPSVPWGDTGAGTDTAVRISAEHQNRAAPGGDPDRGALLQPCSLQSLGRGGGLQPGCSRPRRMGRGVKTVIAASDRMAAATPSLLTCCFPHQPRQLRLCRCHRPGTRGATGNRGRPERCPPSAVGSGYPLLRGVGVSRLFCACQRRVSSFRAIYI